MYIPYGTIQYVHGTHIYYTAPTVQYTVLYTYVLRYVLLICLTVIPTHLLYVEEANLYSVFMITDFLVQDAVLRHSHLHSGLK